MRKFLLLALLELFFLSGSAQSTYRTGYLPSFNLNQKLKNDWRLNYKIEGRAVASQGTLEDPNPYQFDYSLTDLSMLGSHKVGLNNKIAAGYLLRLSDGAPRHRLIQQFTQVKRFTGWRLAQRISSDQTFGAGEALSIRLRYRLSTDLPFNGQTVDEHEFYFKINHEYLLEFESGDEDLEIRLIPYLGYLIDEQNKIEFGLDYRLNGLLLERPSQHTLWLALNWFLTI